MNDWPIFAMTKIWTINSHISSCTVQTLKREKLSEQKSSSYTFVSVGIIIVVYEVRSDAGDARIVRLTLGAVGRAVDVGRLHSPLGHPIPILPRQRETFVVAVDAIVGVPRVVADGGCVAVSTVDEHGLVVIVHRLAGHPSVQHKLIRIADARIVELQIQVRRLRHLIHVAHIPEKSLRQR